MRGKGPEMSATTSLSGRARQLSAAVGGEVVLPGQQRFDQARLAFNLAATSSRLQSYLPSRRTTSLLQSGSPPIRDCKSPRRAPATTPCRSGR